MALAAWGFLVWEWMVTAAFYHAGVGLLFLYVGFLYKDDTGVRLMVGGLGALMLIVKVVTIVTPLMWGGNPIHGPIEITCLVVGVGSILAARFLRS